MEATQQAHITEFINQYVDGYAKPFVSLAFKKGILDFNAEQSNIQSGQWRSNTATREWVAMVTIRAIGQQNKAADLSNTSSTFTDNLTISTWVLGYVNAAVELGIVFGFTGGDFKPKGFVTRAEIAAFLSRAEHYLVDRSESMKTGTITGLTNNSIKIVKIDVVRVPVNKQSEGTIEGFNETEISIFDQKIIEYGSIKQTISNSDVASIFVKGKKIDMIFSNNKLIEVKLSSYYDGVIKLINTTTRAITIEVDGKDQIFVLPTNVLIDIHNKTTPVLSDLKIGDAVRVTLNTAQTSVSIVQLKSTVMYRVISKDETKREVTVNDSKGITSKITIHSNIPMLHHTKAIPLFSGILTTQPIIIHYYGKTITSVDIPSSSIGVLNSLNSVTKSLSMTNYSNQMSTVSWTEQLQVIKDETNTLISLSDLQVNDRIETVKDKSGNVFITLLEKRERRYWKYDQTQDLIYFRNINWSDDIEFKMNQVYLHQNNTPIDISEFSFLNHTEFYLLNGMLIEVEKL